VKVVPGSSRDQIMGWLGDPLKIKVTAPPEKGKANEAVVAVAGDVMKSDVDRHGASNARARGLPT
jgi:uncharacterized protein (TIGR00251 family)